MKSSFTYGLILCMFFSNSSISDDFLPKKSKICGIHVGEFIGNYSTKPIDNRPPYYVFRKESFERPGIMGKFEWVYTGETDNRGRVVSVMCTTQILEHNQLEELYNAVNAAYPKFKRNLLSISTFAEGEAKDGYYIFLHQDLSSNRQLSLIITNLEWQNKKKNDKIKLDSDGL